MEGIATGLAPHVYEVRTSARTMWFLCICLFAPILQSALNDGFSSILIAAVAVASAVAVDLALDVGNPNSAIGVTDGSSVASALILALMLPNTIHPAIAAAGAVFAVVVVKRSFGGLGSNWFNPAVGAWLFVRLCWPASFSSALASSPLAQLSGAVAKGLSDHSGSPLTVLKIAGSKPSALDGAATTWLNENVLSSLGAELPGGYVDLFIPSSAGTIADRGLLLLLAATVVLIALNVIRWIVPFVFVAVYLALSFVWGALPYGGDLFSGDMLYALFSGSVALSAFVLVSDPATGAKTKLGTVFVAAVAGAFAYLFRFHGSDPYGALLAVPATNAFTVLFRMGERRIRFTPRSRA